MTNLPQLQTNNMTFFGRHWAEYQVLRRLKPSDAGMSILSFGCSTGEEIATLKAVFPGAALFGCDNDWNNLRQARSLVGNTATVFSSSGPDLKRYGPYDIIICNSVLLRQSPRQDESVKGIDPSLWCDVVGLLDECLKPGGIVQIINSNIPFRMAPVASKYQPVRSKLLHGSSFVDLFDLSGNHLAIGVGGTGWSAVLPRHIEASHSALLNAYDLHDSHFWKSDGGVAPAPVDDEIIPNFGADSAPWASGSMTYRPELRGDKKRRSTHVEIDVDWMAAAVDRVRVRKRARRIWFDGSVALESETTIDHVGATATAIIETATGQRQTFISMSQALQPNSTRSPQFGIL